MKLTPPTDEKLASATGLAVGSRSTIRRGHLSLVERLRLHQEGTSRTAVLWTVCPALAHERHVHTALQDYAICAPLLLDAGDADDDSDAWLLLGDVDQVPFDELTAAQAAQALVDLAAAHRGFSGRPELIAIPRCDPSSNP